MIADFELAVLTEDITSRGRHRGEVGTVVEVFEDGAAYLIEFAPRRDKEADIIPVSANQVIAKSASKYIKELFRSLNEEGLDRHFLTKYGVPKAYLRGAEDNEAGIDRLRRYFSGYFGLVDDGHDLSSGSRSTFVRPQVRSFSGGSLGEMDLAGNHVAVALAQAALSGYSKPSPASYLSAEELRRELLSTGERYISFEILLDYCWRIGVPVLHASNLPRQSRKSRGAALEIEGHPVIVLCQRHTSPSKQLLPLAHELGHIANQHIKHGTLVSSSLHQFFFDEETELEARTFARRLIAGSSPTRMTLSHGMSYEAIANEARYEGERTKTDPGYLIALEQGGNTYSQQALGAALKSVDNGDNAIENMRQTTDRQLDWNSMLPEASFLVRSIALDEVTNDPSV